jgi:hypothetical protein
MKRIFFSLLAFFVLVISAKAQNSYTFQSQDWAYLIGKSINSINSDSASATEFRKIRDAIRTANPASWTTNVTVSNIPDWVGLAFYRTVKTAGAGEIAARYTAITTQIEGKASLTTTIATYNLRITADFDRTRNAGKTITIDN